MTQKVCKKDTKSWDVFTFTSMTVSTWIPAEALVLRSLEGLRCPQQQCELVLNLPQRRAGLAASWGPQRNGFKAHVNSPAWPTHRQSPFGSKCQRWKQERERDYLTHSNTGDKLWNADPLLWVWAFIRPKSKRKREVIAAIADVGFFWFICGRS